MNGTKPETSAARITSENLVVAIPHSSTTETKPRRRPTKEIRLAPNLPNYLPDGVRSPLLEQEFSVIEILSQTASSIVLLIETPQGKQLVAKAIPLGAESQLISREFLIGRHHDIPNLTKPYYIIEDAEAEYAFIVMEKLGPQYQQLDRLLANQQLSYQTMVEIFRQITPTLTQLDQKEILHRDLKPGNIWVDIDIDDEGNQVVNQTIIGDFGLSINKNGHDHDASKIHGTLAFMPPERISNPELLLVESEIYSLGVIFHYMITKRPYFLGQNGPQITSTDTTAQALKQISMFNQAEYPNWLTKEELISLVDQGINLLALYEVLTKTITANHQDRYSSYLELMAAIEITLDPTSLEAVDEEAAKDAINRLLGQSIFAINGLEPAPATQDLSDLAIQAAV